MNNTKQKNSLQNGVTIRRMNLKQDYDQLISFFDLVFSKELEAKGGSIRQMFQDMKKVLPFFKLIGFFVKKVRYIFNGFIGENEQGQIISTINAGYSGNYWEVSMVATHPDYRRQGIARNLLNTAIEYARLRDAERLVLEVLENNDPAFKLYQNFGFSNFDVQSKLKLQPDPNFSVELREIPSPYIIRKIKRTKKINLQRYNLAQIATPEQVQKFLPVNRIQFIKPFMIRVLQKIARFFFKMNKEEWGVYHPENETVMIGNASIFLARSDKDINRIIITLDPNHIQNTAESLISHVLDFLLKNKQFDVNTLVELRSSNHDMIEILQKYNFQVYEKYDVMGKIL